MGRQEARSHRRLLTFDGWRGDGHGADCEGLLRRELRTGLEAGRQHTRSCVIAMPQNRISRRRMGLDDVSVNDRFTGARRFRRMHVLCRQHAEQRDHKSGEHRGNALRSGGSRHDNREWRS